MNERSSKRCKRLCVSRSTNHVLRDAIDTLLITQDNFEQNLVFLSKLACCAMFLESNFCAV